MMGEFLYYIMMLMASIAFISIAILVKDIISDEKKQEEELINDIKNREKDI